MRRFNCLRNLNKFNTSLLSDEKDVFLFHILMVLLSTEPQKETAVTTRRDGWSGSQNTGQRVRGPVSDTRSCLAVLLITNDAYVGNISNKKGM
jgi:hypothetical protein